MEIRWENPLAGLSANIQRLDAGQPRTQRVQKPLEANPVADDRIELSVKSREALRLDTLIRSIPDIREQRVEEIRNAIANGTYNVKAEMVAEKMINGLLMDDI